MVHPLRNCRVCGVNFRPSNGKHYSCGSLTLKTGCSYSEYRRKQRVWNIANADRYKKTIRDWYWKNRNTVSARNKRFYQNNKELFRPRWIKYRASKRNAEGIFTAEEWEQLKALCGYRCVRCFKKKKLSVDHIIPLSKGGTNYISNLQPLCKSCNSAKRDRIWFASCKLSLKNTLCKVS